MPYCNKRTPRGLITNNVFGFLSSDNDSSLIYLSDFNTGGTLGLVSLENPQKENEEKETRQQQVFASFDLNVLCLFRTKKTLVLFKFYKTVMSN